MKNITEKNKPISEEMRLKMDTQELFKTQNEIIIIHRGEEYRLRITSNDKLILTK
jgi:hemin uptake protein HemP